MLFLNRISKSKKFLILKTTAITTVAASVIAFSNGPAAFAASAKSSTIYHVYLNGTYIGNVTNKDVANKIIAEKADATKGSFKAMDLKIGPKDQYISEQALRTASTTEETIPTIKDTFYIEAEATAIVIDGKPVVYVENKETAEEVMKKLKLRYVSQDQLNDLEARKASENMSLPELKENESRLLDVRLSKNISIEAENIAPERIMSANEAVTFLQKGTLEEKKYVIQAGDVLETIANSHHLKMVDILAINPGLTKDTLLMIGQEINITVPKPFIEVIVDKEVKKKEKIAFTNEVIKNSSMPKGETKEKQKGQNGSRLVTYSISEQNGVSVKKEQLNEQIQKQAVNHIVIKGTKVIPSRGDGSFAWPTVGGYISSKQGPRWGRMHKGIDIAGPNNRSIMAADNGVVVFAGWGGGYGNKIIIDHHNGYRTLYGHMSSLKVKAGQTVSKGTSIGVMGATGDATGIHLHFEVYKNSGLVNPLSYLR
ncbi:peptidoglycan DD-metalloendopeptidase family protein [Neobacillus soli]|uniref:peptidoglycan DD-metalloendopeptidase family protein n=1 Tax=Neobacillus soli TaxID=220688 RepID=UPI00082525AD|nr:peptidoglycan DD-metalloendopeptidase family protein [Neobacillus soli]